MDRKEFEKVIKAIESEIGEYTNGYNLIEESEFLHDNNIDFKEVYSEVLGEGRWSISRMVVFKIANAFHLAVIWNDPATEMQEGQPTDCYLEEVIPFEETVIKYMTV